MSANPTESSPFSADEMQDFFEVVPPEKPADGEKSAAEGEDDKYSLSGKELMDLMDQNKRDTQIHLDQLRQQLLDRYDKKEEKPKADAVPGVIPLKTGPDGKAAVIYREDLEPLIQEEAQKRIDQYHKENIDPYRSTVDALRDDKEITDAVGFLKQSNPKLLEGKTEDQQKQLGRLAVDIYYSGFNKGGTYQERAHEVASQMEALFGDKGFILPKSTGDGRVHNRAVAASNQVGRTDTRPDDGGNPFGFGKGATVRVKSKSINDVGGISEYQQYAAQIQNLHDYNEQNRMGWKIIME